MRISESSKEYQSFTYEALSKNKIFVNTRSHPTFLAFESQFFDIEDHEKAWELLVEGIHLQQEINITANEALKGDIWNIGDKFWTQYCHDKGYRNICIQIYKDFIDEKSLVESASYKEDISLDQPLIRFLRNVIKSNNPKYLEFASIMKESLTVDPNKDLALWSGGVELSDVSFEYYKKCPLEKTKLGGFLNTSILVSNWDLEAPLWNIISRTFVNEFVKEATSTHKRSAHVFIRTIERQSVLLRQELPMLELNQNINIIWHPLINTGTRQGIKDIAEIGKDGGLINPDHKNRGYQKKDAFNLLIEKLRNSEPYDINKIAHKHIFDIEFKELKAPFAVYENN